MISESLIMGLIVLLLCGAACFYMYVRMTFLEKKFVVMESILVDLRVAMDSLMMEHMSHPAAPIAVTPGVQLPPPVPMSSPEAEAIPEENFYSSVLEQAHEKDGAQEGQSADAVLESFETAAAAPPDEQPVKQNLDTMTRADLAALAESKGIRVKRSMNRGEVLSLLRRLDPAQNEGLATGAENVSGSAGGTQQLGSSLDGVTPMDMEQSEQLDQ
jgi:hypothetical protein